MNRKDSRLPLWLIVAYGCIAMPLSTIGLPLSIYLAPFYAGELGLSLAALGTAMVLARLVDVVVDPVIGIVSDRWRPSAGRRKIWLPIGVAALGVGSWMLFQPGTANIGIAYFFIWTTIMYLGFTATKLPYEAWGAELSTDYAERTRVASFRQAFSLIGLVVATVVPALILMQPGRWEWQDGMGKFLALGIIEHREEWHVAAADRLQDALFGPADLPHEGRQNLVP